MASRNCHTRGTVEYYTTTEIRELWVPSVILLVFHVMETPSTPERSLESTLERSVTGEALDLWKATGWVIGAALVRAVLSAMVPLLPDETYYWDWSRHLAAGYYDHPPAIAWLIAIGTGLAGSTVTGVRLGPALAAVLMHAAGVLCTWFIAGGGREGSIAAKRAAQLITLIPIATLGLVLATPDVLLFAATMLALVAVERALAAPLKSSRSLWWWVSAGVFLGVAFLAKYTAVLLPLGLVAACLVHPRLRQRFREPGPWLAGVIALLMFVPVVLWNQQHDWVSFQFQLGHGFTRAARGNPVSRELEMLGAQMGLASPILFVLLAMAVLVALRDGWRARVSHDITSPLLRRFALAAVALTPLVFFCISAWRRPVEANWPAMIYPAAIVLLASGKYQWMSGDWWKRGLWLGGALLALVAVQAWKPILPLKPTKDPIARAHGWQRLAAVVDSVRLAAFGASTSTVWIAGERYQVASELAFHMNQQPEVFSLNLGGRSNQYDIWPNAFERIQPGGNLVVVFDASTKGDSLARIAGSWFDVTQSGPVVALQRNGRDITKRKVWLYERANELKRPARNGR